MRVTLISGQYNSSREHLVIPVARTYVLTCSIAISSSCGKSLVLIVHIKCCIIISFKRSPFTRAILRICLRLKNTHAREFGLIIFKYNYYRSAIYFLLIYYVIVYLCIYYYFAKTQMRTIFVIFVYK